MKPNPRWLGAILLAACGVTMGWSQETSAPPAETAPPPQPGTPAPLNAEDFQELYSNSPFTRALNLSDSLILTGIAKIGEETIATVLNKDSKETYVVSGNPNAQGWRLSEVEGDQTNLERVTAKIAVSGGEVVSVRFDEKQLKPGEAKPAAGSGFREGSSSGRSDGSRGGSDGYRGPPPEVREMMGRLSEEQRRELFDRMRRMREENPDMSREEMSERFRRDLERAVSRNEQR